jgi:PAS domain S-box-containing protein
MAEIGNKTSTPAADITELKEAQSDLVRARDDAQRHAREVESANRELRSEIAERLEAEKRLRESEEKFRLLVDGVKDYAIFMLDPQGYVVSWNQGAERIKGYSAGEIVGKHFSKFYLPEDVESGKPEEALRIAALEGRYEAESWRLRKNGSRFWANVVITALRDNTGRLHGFSKITRDMTERKLFQQELQENERLAAMGTTAAVFAHEIGNPLNAISSTLQLLKRQLDKQKEVSTDYLNTSLESVLHEIQHLGSLLDDFRSLARPHRLELQPIDLSKLVAELVATQRAECEVQGVQVEQDLAPDLPMIKADARRLKQALFNLCKNALEAMPTGGTLTIRGSHSDGIISLQVIDTGTGIPDDLDIFELFITTKEQGTGLGLAIVRQIVAAHHGMISYRSQRGKGTSFTLSLPVEPSDSPKI